MMIFKKVCQNRIKPEIWNDWEKKEFGPHRGKNGERAGERQREGGSRIKWKVKKKERGRRYMGIRVWWRKIRGEKKRKKKNETS